MKLNLLPARSAKAGGGEGSGLVWAVPLAIILAAGGIGWMFYATNFSESEIARQKERIDKAKPYYEEAVAVSKRVDETIAKAQGLVLNANLADAMLAHNTKYTELYDEVRKYIPPYFRVTSMTASPNGNAATTVNITGVIDTFQQYADLMSALVRIPGAVSVSRAGFQDDPMRVPNLVETDQTGRPFKGSQGRRPDDALERMDLMISEAGSTDFDGAGNFGSMDSTVTQRDAMPDSSVISVAIVIQGKDITTPNPRATLATAAALWPPVTAPVTTTPAGGTTPPAGNQPANAQPGGRPRPGGDNDE